MDLSKFRPTCLKLMDSVKARRFTVAITKRGKPIAKMVPLEGLDSGSAVELIRNINR
jgi:prevent-host-death family protein